VPGAESQTAALAKIGVGSSGAHGDLTVDAAKELVFAVLTNPGDAMEEDFPPAGFWRRAYVRPSAPRAIYAYYFRDTTIEY
jgi:hypothetical protein